MQTKIAIKLDKFTSFSDIFYVMDEFFRTIRSQSHYGIFPNSAFYISFCMVKTQKDLVIRGNYF